MPNETKNAKRAEKGRDPETANELEKTMSRKAFAGKLRRLADALDAAQPFTIHIHGVRLNVPRNAVLSVEYENEGDTRELEFQLTWKQN